MSDLKQFYRGKRIFLTGHTGFKGSWLVAWLNKLGAEVKGYALAPKNDFDLYHTIKGDDLCESIIADIRDKERLENELISFQPDLVFHLAAQPLVRESYEIPVETFEVNAIGTANLLQSVRSLNKKCVVIIITTDKVYHNYETDYHYQEDDKLGGYDPYSASKACAEIITESYRNSFFSSSSFDKHQKVVTSARAGNVIGGGDWSKDRIIPDIVKALKVSQTIEVRKPNSVRPWQHVLEPLGGYLLLGLLNYQDPLNYSSAYNFGPAANEHLAVKDLVEIAIDSWGHGSWKDTSNSNDHHEAGLLKLSINKATEELKWQPKLNSRQAIEWTLEWYKQLDGDIIKFMNMQIDIFQDL